MTMLPLSQARESHVFGGKAASLAEAMNCNMPVPNGFALSTAFVYSIHLRHPETVRRLEEMFKERTNPVAVRSSAIGEDGKNASFAGQHISLLNVTTFDGLLDAIDRIRESGETEAARTYRAKMNIESTDGSMAVVVQEMIAADSAGVLFTRNPLSKQNEFVIESGWGVGEVVVAGMIIPDYFRMSLDGDLLEERLGVKDICLQLCVDGGTEEVTVGEDRAEARSLSGSDLSKLHRLGQQCKKHYGDSLDIEWCLLDGEIYLLQCRPITALAA